MEFIRRWPPQYAHPQRPDATYKQLWAKADDLATHILNQEDWEKSRDNRVAREIHRTFNTGRLMACLREAKDEYLEYNDSKACYFFKHARKLYIKQITCNFFSNSSKKDYATNDTAQLK